jgi:hypothetical protein
MTQCKKDVAALERILHDDLLYVHSSGGVADSKESYIAGLRDGLWDYSQISRSVPVHGYETARCAS